MSTSRQRRNLLRAVSKTLSYSDMRRWAECPAQFWHWRMRAQAARSVKSQIGELTHKQASLALEVREEQLKQDLAEVPAEHRPQLERATRRLLAVSDKLDKESPGSDSLGKDNRKFSWTDPETGWELLAKPDKIGMVANGESGTVLQISEKKSTAISRERDFEQLDHFATVVSLAMEPEYTGPIRLVLELLGAPADKQPKPIWYDRSERNGKLEKIRTVIREAEKALAPIAEVVKNAIAADADLEPVLASQGLPEKPGAHCNTCEYRKGCAGFRAWAMKYPYLVEASNRQWLGPLPKVKLPTVRLPRVTITSQLPLLRRASAVRKLS